ncbi:hypothetical protein [Hymenobacter sp. UYCo722]|uniref:hypothetical protein n=1 Tax=Hymenobacter sp. UYCo722 TaxID=3156335 RepID=UPI003392224F
MPASVSPRLVPLLTLLLATLLLLSAGLYNGFPLVTSDSGSYINSAIHFEVPNDRPIVYGLFIRATGLKFSLWLVVLAQALLLAWVLLRCVAEFAPRVRHRSGRLVLVGLTLWATGASYYCCQLMPDIFSAIGLLALALLLLGPVRPVGERVGLLATAALATLMHNSNLLAFTLVVLGFGLVAWWQGLFRRQLASRRQWGLTTATVLACWVLLPAIHAAFGGGFVLSRATPVFLVGRLVEAGIVDKYLDRNCDTAQPLKLCAFRDKLPNDAITFLWDEKSPYYQTGGLEDNLDEYRTIVGHILTTPRYYPYLIQEGLRSTLRQLTHLGHGDGLVPFRENTNPYWKVQEFASYELKAYMSSLQNRGSLHFEDLNARFYGAVLLSLLVAAGLIGGARRSAVAAARYTPLLLLLLVLGLGLVANAFVTGALANVLDRLQGRVAWLLPFAALLVVAEHGPDGVRRAWQLWCRPAATPAPGEQSVI